MQLADTPWPLIVIWVVAILFARLAKQKKTPPPTRRLDAPDDPTDRARSDMGDALQRAMEKLKQAERDAKAGRIGGQVVRRTVAPMPARVPARPPARTSIRLVLEDHSGLSQESEPEVVDYDDAAAALVDTRRREAEAYERGDVPASPQQSSSVAPSARPPVRPSGPLARYADGSLRGAVILGEVLGRPISDR